MSSIHTFLDVGQVGIANIPVYLEIVSSHLSHDESENQNGSANRLYVQWHQY